ncbi:ESPR-type extended signal peptide-containing protein [Acinetobacter schindleri]|uniref:ESPR-type extended signal peptide-containing protein n=1 Tax=Acinetobacter schindleri TaxID=108981 RepID=UPI0032B4E033
MNHIYRIIWNETLGAWVAVAENVKRKGKRSSVKLAALSITTILGLVHIPAFAKNELCMPDAGCNSFTNLADSVVLKQSPTQAYTDQKISITARADDGSNGRTGALFVKPKAGKPGGNVGTSWQYSHVVTSDISDTTGLDPIEVIYHNDAQFSGVGVPRGEYMQATFTPHDVDGNDIFLDEVNPRYQVDTVNYSSSGVASAKNTTTVNVTLEFNVDSNTGQETYLKSVQIPHYDLNIDLEDRDQTNTSGKPLSAELNYSVHGGNQTLNFTKTATAVELSSRGGDGGNGGQYILGGKGKPGGVGGDASNSVLNLHDLDIAIVASTRATEVGKGSTGVLVKSQGGDGGDGGGSYTIDAGGGKGNVGGEGQKASANIFNTHIKINDDYSSGVVAISAAGDGGNGGKAGGIVSSGGKGNSAGQAGEVEIYADRNSRIEIIGSHGNGLLAQSVGGAGGSSGASIGIVSMGGQGGHGGNANNVKIINEAEILIKGTQSNAITAQSVGGGGGNGGSGFGLVTLGSMSGAGGNSSIVDITNSNQLAVEGQSSHGIVAQSIGGGGGNTGLTAGMVALGGKQTGTTAGGGNASLVIVNNTTGGDIATLGDGAHAVIAQSIGGGGGNAGLSVGVVSFGANGGKGGHGAGVTVNNNANITTNYVSTANNESDLQKEKASQVGSIGILAQSIGGGGGNGGNSVATGAFVSLAMGGKGGAGGDSGNIQVSHGSTGDSAPIISTKANHSNAIKAQSIGGGGGNAGYAVSNSAGSGFSFSLAMAKDGGAGGTSGDVQIDTLSGELHTTGDRSAAIVAQSIGGAGGDGGVAGAGTVSAGFSLGLSLGGEGGHGGTAGSVIVNNNSLIDTRGADSSAIVAQSIGGDGGAGGAVYSFAGGMYAGAVGLGGDGGAGGNSNSVTVTNSADITTQGANSSAILSQSIGGNGGNAGMAITGALGNVSAGLSLGGESRTGGSAKLSKIHSLAKRIITRGNNATAIIAQSIGGDGGNGGNAIGVSGSVLAGAGIGVGGKGGAGGTAGTVEVVVGDATTASEGVIITKGLNSGAVLAQSIGGSGGNGGYAIGAAANVNVAGGLSAGVALGGTGGKGGSADTVTLTSHHAIFTEGENSSGLTAQSMGGDGGNGGMALGIAATGSLAGIVTLGGLPSVALSAAVGGRGGSGGIAKSVDLTSQNIIGTKGNNSNAILAQSLGGGGGSGGFSGAFSLSASKVGAIAASVVVGGTGGDGGQAGTVNVDSFADIVTEGHNSSAIYAQSIGGTGGKGGMSLAVSAAVGSSAALSLGASVGGDGGNGGTAKSVEVNSQSNITTAGDFSHAILAQSINGNGGSGGNAINASVSLSNGPATNASVSIGGEGGGVATFKDKDGNDLKDQYGRLKFKDKDDENIIVYRNLSGERVDEQGRLLDRDNEYVNHEGYQVTAHGHFILSDNKIVDAEGRERDEKGNYLVAGKRYNDQGFEVTSEGYVVTAQGNVNEVGNRVDAKGNELVENQNVIHIDQSQWRSTDLTTINPINDFEAKRVLTTVDQYEGDWKNYLASILTEKLEREHDLNHVTVNVGKPSATPNVDEIKEIKTSGMNADAIVAQSIGGNGGTGGLSLNGTLSSGQSATNLAVAVGGGGGDGGVAGDVFVNNHNTLIETTGKNSSAILAESIGGNGGKGGTSISASLTNAKVQATSLTASVGGGGGLGNEAGDVTVISNNQASLKDAETLKDIATISTLGDLSHGIAAKSIGGGGGQGGFAGNFSLNYGQTQSSSLSASVTIGGGGGSGNRAGDVYVDSTDNIVTKGINAIGIKAESIGGGGGSGGKALDVNINATEGTGIDLGVTLGGDSGSGNVAGQVQVDSDGLIITKGDYSHAIYAKSLGGGGGDGGFAVTGSLSNNVTSLQANVGVGGFGGDGNRADVVTVNRMGDIYTRGTEAVGIFAQSIGGGGGDGGMAITANLAKADSYQLGFTLGGAGGDGHAGSKVNIDNVGTILTKGFKSQAIKAQSIGGGGGNGGTSAAFNAKGINIKSNFVITAAVGGWGGDGGFSDKVTVKNDGLLITRGDSAQAILAQSIGGGGGDGGNAYSGTLMAPSVGPQGKTTSFTFALGGFAGEGNKSGEVDVQHTGDIYTEGDRSSAVQAQSIGGGGGNGGNASTLAVNMQCDEVCADQLKNENLSSPPSTSISTSIGGLGGIGNDANTVTVNTKGLIQTQGNSSNGIYAQSIGGGGGDGGSTFANSTTITGAQKAGSSNFSVGIGGYYGSGGHGGDVSVTHANSIMTNGYNSKGILAESIGGGGGNGGDTSGSKIGVGGGAFQDEMSHLLDKLKESLSNLGTDELAKILPRLTDGAAGDGGDVIVNTRLDAEAGEIEFTRADQTTFTLKNFIMTQGQFSDAIFAQSVGGGGGIGGTVEGGTPEIAFEIEVNLPTGEKDEYGNDIYAPKTVKQTIKKADGGLFALGGDGGAGGDGGVVTVNNELDLYTGNKSSRGIFAQSVGGGGGAGGDSDGKSTIGIGGSGSMAGKGGEVSVNNQGSIYTQSTMSEGILAQSIGGGGGAGGSVEQATIALGGGTLTTLLNGFGANLPVNNGQDGGLVKVLSGSKAKLTTIATQGNLSSAILAQSIGGGGGVGGHASGTVAVGGAGAAGGDGGVISIDNLSNLQTLGDDSSAILAQSIGGGGGVGGNSDGGNKNNETKSAMLSVGGNGSAGGNGNDLTVKHDAQIQTLGNNSKGILLQSIGGGGGVAGSTKDFSTDEIRDEIESIGLGSGVNKILMKPLDLADTVIEKVSGWVTPYIKEYLMSGSVKGGDAGTVRLSLGPDSAVQTSGHASEAIVAQSIAGGGGSTGSTAGLLIAGASAGASGISGVVQVDHTGEAFTFGQNSSVIVAQSIGGGGGLSSGIDQISQFAQLGAEGATGLANTVSVSNSGILFTKDKLSQGIIAQSISGGGGATALSHQLVLGGADNADSHAEDVTVSNSGYIETTTDGSSAIVAQSIGGGGGFAAGVVNGNVSAGNGMGDGADVSVTNGTLSTRKLAAASTDTTLSKGITTFGNYAHGIIAQSISNGGGYSNNVDASGNVTGYQTVAQSALVSGNAGNVNVDQHDNIYTTGVGSVGILAQSTGFNAGTIIINNTADALIRGGSAEGAAIRLIDGRNNAIHNAGILTGSASDNVFGQYLSGQHDLIDIGLLNANAVLAGNAEDTINNTGFITGNLDLGSGTNALNNRGDGWIISGQSQVINGVVRNEANWAVSGVNLVGQTDLIGDFSQEQSGTLFWDWNFKSAASSASINARALAAATPNYDVLNVSGNAVVDGVLSINIMDSGYVKPGDFVLDFINAKSVDISALKLDAVASAVAKYNRSVIDGRGAIVAEIDFAQKGLSKNGLSLGEAINQIQLNEVATFRPVAAPLFYRPDLAALQDTYNLLSGEGVVASQQLYFTQNAGVMSDLSTHMDFWRSKSVHDQNGGFATVSCSAENEAGSARTDVKNCLEDNKWSLWLAGHNGEQEQRGKTSSGMANVNSDSYRTMVGLDVAVTPNTLIGVAYSNGKTQYEVQDRLTTGLMDFEGVNIFASHRIQDSYVKALIGYDRVSTKVNRYAFIDPALDPIVQVAGVENNLTGEAKANAYSLRLETGRLFELDGVNVTPFIGAQYSQLDTKAFRESALESTDPLALQYEKTSVYSAPLFIGAQFDKNFVFSEGVIQPYARFAFSHELSSKREMDASFVSAPGYVFRTQGGEPQRNSFDMNVGFKMTSITNLSIFGQYYGKYASSSSSDQGGSIGLELNW